MKNCSFHFILFLKSVYEECFLSIYLYFREIDFVILGKKNHITSYKQL